ncbi:MAG: DUF58 domain-containing protein [Ferruginibacter sp.]
MSLIKKYIGDLFIPHRFYLVLCGVIMFFITAFFIPAFYTVARIIFVAFVFLTITDYVFLFLMGRAPRVKRLVNDRLSNADPNQVALQVMNRMVHAVTMTIIDELPEQFQLRNFNLIKHFKAREEQLINYTVTPVERGVYNFGDTHLYISSRLGLIVRRYTAATNQDVAVYPSFMQLKKYQLISKTTLLNEHGSKRMRKIGQSMEFEQIKDYVSGDDVRTLNWKATARKGMLMINNYADEKSQQVYCIIDKGRLMKMPFAGLTLLDYAINSTLVMSNVCLQRQDKIGLITFADKIGSIIAADRKPIQRENILDALYRQQTTFLESDFEMLYMNVRHKIKQRSLLILYTNFESLNGLRRQINYLRSIAKHHLLLVVFFENTELSTLAHADALNLEDVYIKTIADKFVFEKKLIVKELQTYGILSILTAPEKLTINTVNKYVELKTKQAL